MKELTISDPEKMGEYMKELEGFIGDPSTKRCVLTAQGRNINMLVDVALKFRDGHAKVVKIDDITIGTVRGLPIKAGDYPKSMSVMKIVMLKRESLKE
ncbi:MAG: hypothetical protein GYA24_01445 [Candidatus Lokiarchaeota archaeon]|nr:hypothetical protein [Candidatus Lokiarchaeota archaeon]